MEEDGSQPAVVIVVLNWNGLADTTACLESLARLDYRNYEIVVVDNGSKDGSVEHFRAAYPDMILFENQVNKGFTGGNNIGINYAMRRGADYVWLLNNDTVIAPESLNKLVECAEVESSAGMLSPLICYFDDPERVQFRGSVINWETMELSYPASNEELASWGPDQRRDMCLWGTALLIKRRVIERIGTFRENYFAYWEDTEYCLRAIRAGFRNVLVANVRVLHKNPLPGTVMFQRKPHFFFYMMRNRHFLECSYLNSGRLVRRLKANLSYALRKYRQYADIGEQVFADAYLDGIWNAYLRRGGSWEERLKAPRLLKRIASSRLMGRLLDEQAAAPVNCR